MKTLKAVLVMLLTASVNGIFAQSDNHLKLSDEYPGAGKKVSVTYNPSGTVLEGKTPVSAIVYYLDNKENPAADIILKSNGKVLTGELSIPETAKAFFIKISVDEQIDDNNENGYIYMIYKDKKPVEGAYATKAVLLSSGMGAYFAKIKNNVNEGIELYQKEFALYPQSDKEYAESYYLLIANNPDYKNKVNGKIASLEKTTDEKDLLLAAKLLKATNNKIGADSINNIIKNKFPDGISVKAQLGNAFYQEKDLTKKDSLYNVYIKRFPENTSEKNTVQDNFRVQLAGLYLENNNIEAFEKYEKLIRNRSGLAMSLNNVAYEMAKKGDRLNEAEKLSKQSLDITAQNINNPVTVSYSSPSQVKAGNQYNYDLYADTYAFILFKENKFKEALTYEQPVVEHIKVIDPDIYENYIAILDANGQYKDAEQAAENAVKAGKSTPGIQQELKKDYVKVKGSDSGYEEYLASLGLAAKNKAKADLAKTMISQPAPSFTLKDADGTLVSLKDLKGKIVIVDFWATWCGPCKASFPGMQLAINKYKDDPNIKFLFIDTWENGDNYVAGVKKFIADNNYTFHVLIDEKTAEGKQGKVVGTFGVTGIPTKFVIDKNGNIRFKYVGYSGSPEGIVDELTAMVDMATEAGSAVAAK